MSETMEPRAVTGWDHPGYQQCRKDRQTQAEAITQLEAENAALWAFVAAHDEEIEALIAYGRWDESTEPEAQSQLTKRVLAAKEQITATRSALNEYRP